VKKEIININKIDKAKVRSLKDKVARTEIVEEKSIGYVTQIRHCFEQVPFNVNSLMKNFPYNFNDISYRLV